MGVCLNGLADGLANGGPLRMDWQMGRPMEGPFRMDRLGGCIYLFTRSPMLSKVIGSFFF